MSNITQLGHYQITETLLETAAVSVYFASMSWGDGQQSTVVLKAFDRAALPLGLAETDLHSGIDRYRALVGETLVRLLDVFETDERVVLVLEHVDGIGLDVLLMRLRSEHTMLEDDAVIYLMSRVFSGLAIAHEAVTPDTHDRAPIVHGEVQPSCILVVPDGRVCVGEFPLTTFVAPWRSILTTKDRVASGHLAPEQITRGVATLRSDVYSATLVLWELLARRAYIDLNLSDIDRMVHIAEPDVPPLERVRPDIDPRILDIVRRGLVVSESLRTPTASEIAQVLAACVVLDTGRVKLRQAVARAVDISKPLGAASFVISRASMAPPSLSSVSTRSNDASLVGLDGVPERASSEVSFSGLDLAGSALSESSSRLTPALPSTPETWFGGSDSTRSAVAIPLPDYSNLSLGNDADDSSFDPPQRPSRRWWIAGGVAALILFPVAGALSGWNYKQSKHRPPATSIASADASLQSASSLVPDAGVVSTAPQIVATIIDAGPSSDLRTARLFTVSFSRGFRVFVDGVVVGQTPDSFDIKCGSRKIKVGSAGAVRIINVPCGGTYTPTP